MDVDEEKQASAASPEVSQPYNTGCLPLNYGSNPGVNGDSYVGR
jgi:hypothetical protein